MEKERRGVIEVKTVLEPQEPNDFFVVTADGSTESLRIVDRAISHTLLSRFKNPTVVTPDS